MARTLASPNHDARPRGAAVDTLVLHYTGMRDLESALARLTDPAAKVSAHYVVDEGGDVLRLVPEERRAWHAGVSSWRGHAGVNGRSIGIELVNPGHEFGYRPFPARQMAAFFGLAAGILARHPIPPERVLGHSDVAPSRRRDPGELFDWRGAAAEGIGIWPDSFSSLSSLPESGVRLARGAVGERVRSVQSRLARIGYGIAPTGRFDAATRDVVAAFQRHFRPERVDGVVDAETNRRLDVLANG